MAVSAILLLVSGFFFEPLYTTGLIGMVIFAALIAIFIATMILVPDVKHEEATDIELERAKLSV